MTGPGALTEKPSGAAGWVFRAFAVAYAIFEILRGFFG
jgi:hypothetical protein